MNHSPVTFLRAAGGGNRWVRLDGFATAEELADQLRQPTASN
jgi:hypothetical protein